MTSMRVQRRKAQGDPVRRNDFDDKLAVACLAEGQNWECDEKSSGGKVKSHGPLYLKPPLRVRLASPNLQCESVIWLEALGFRGEPPWNLEPSRCSVVLHHCFLEREAWIIANDELSDSAFYVAAV